MSIRNSKLWNPVFKTPVLALGAPALVLGLAVGAAFAVKKPEAHAEDGAFAGLGDRIEAALQIDRVKLSKRLIKDEIARGNLEKLRVHVNQVTFIEYDSGEVEAGHTVSSDGIEDISKRQIHRLKISPKAKGKIIAVSDDHATIHVTFDRECAEAACALKFVADQGKFLLADVPPMDGYPNVSVIATILGIRHREGHLVAPENGGPMTNLLNRPFREQIELQVRKDTLTEVEVTKENLEGVE